MITGYVDIGGGLEDTTKIANEALVIMAVGLKARWKAPISFHLTRGCTAETQRELLSHAITALQEQNIAVRALSMDGLATNLATATLLGCDLPNGKFDFTHDGNTVSIGDYLLSME